MTPQPDDSRLTILIRATLGWLRAHTRTLAVLALVSALAYFGWPTPYRYASYKDFKYTTTVRISRLSGRAEVLTVVGWLPMEPLPRYRADNPFAP